MVSTILFKKVVSQTVTEWYDVDQTLPEPRPQHFAKIRIDTGPNQDFVFQEFDGIGQNIRLDAQGVSETGVYILENPGLNGDTFDANADRYTFATGRPNRWKTPDENAPIGFKGSLLLDLNGTKHELSQLIELIGQENQIVVEKTSETSARVKLADNLTFTALTVTGDADIGGEVRAQSASISGSLNAQAASISGSVNAQDADISGMVSAQEIVAQGQITAGQSTSNFATLKQVYSAANPPPAGNPGTADLFQYDDVDGKRKVMFRITT